MVFLGVYKAIYDYSPQGEGELAIEEGDLLFVLEKSDEDDWWKAKKKARSDEEEEPEGLIPNNYVDEAEPIHKAKALYDYSRQTDEELSFPEDAILEVYDTSDPDWTLVGLKGEYGFAPANYIETTDDAPALPAMPLRPRMPDPEPEEPPTPSSTGTPTQSPAVALAGILAQKTGSSSAPPARGPISPPPAALPRPAQYTPEESDEGPPAPSLPRRPPSEQLSPPPPSTRELPRSLSPPGVQASLPYNRHASAYDEDSALTSPGGFHLYNIHEMIQHNGKNRKMPCILGINIPKGLIMISPEKTRDGPQQEWSAEKLTHYSIEGKHVFVELVRPSRSLDLHAGAKDTAQEIVAALGEIAGASRAEGLREVIGAATGSQQKKGKMLYDFMAQGEDEVTVAVDDEVIVIDDTKSDEWWMVRRLKNGNEGVVPSSYVEITGTISVSPPTSGINAGRSTVEQNRLEEERMTKQAARRSRPDGDAAEVGPGLSLPKRMSSLNPGGTERRNSQRTKSEGKETKSKPKPDASKVRTWTDRTRSFKVEAEYIGLRDGKIHLHKLNGVKIAVPVQKMSVEDLEYVERISGVSLDDDKPLSSIKRRTSQKAADRSASDRSRAGISVEQPKRPEYDWFDFFLQCGVNPQICERYASSFSRDEMREEDMEGITPELCRTLGIKEGDILRVMKFLDNKFGRKQASGAPTAENANGGLFSGAGGALKNNTGRTRPAPPGQSNDVVDAKALQGGEEKANSTEGQPTPIASAPKPESRLSTGFEDNAWEPRQVQQQPTAAPATSAISAASATTAPAPAPVQRAPTGAAADLTGLSQPLQPTPAPAPAPVIQPQSTPPAQQQPAQPQGATPSLFEQLAKANPQQPTNFTPQQTGGFNQQQQFGPSRQRPQPPPQVASPGGLAPPPQRAASVPNQQTGFQPPPLQPQLTGYNPQFQTQTPSGQSMQDMRQQALQQQQFQNQQRQQQGFGASGQFQNGIQPQPTGFGQFQPQGLQPQPTGFGQFGQFGQPPFQQPSVQQQFMNGQMAGSPFADPNPRQSFQPMPTGYQNGFQQMQPQPTGINSFLPPALTPQRTGALSNNMQFGQPPQQLQQQAPQVPSMPQQHMLAPLQPQKTGPAPPVRFGVQPAPDKLVPQPTGRADLSKATPQNPFGF